MIRSMIFAAVAAALVIPSTVEAASLHRYKRHGHHARVWNEAPVGLYGGGYGHRAYGFGGYGGYAGPNAYTTGPRWASPNQCFEDLGYGRYESCDW
jgi:hypothetical protein